MLLQASLHELSAMAVILARVIKAQNKEMTEVLTHGYIRCHAKDLRVKTIFPVAIINMIFLFHYLIPTKEITYRMTDKWDKLMNKAVPILIKQRIDLEEQEIQKKDDSHFIL